MMDIFRPIAKSYDHPPGWEFWNPNTEPMAMVQSASQAREEADSWGI